MQNNYWDYIARSGNTVPDAIRLAMPGSQSDIKGQQLPSDAAQNSGGGGGMVPPGSQTGGSGGPSMDARVAVLEAHVEHIRSDLAKLSDVPAKVAVIEEKVAALPTKDWIDERLHRSLVRVGITVTIISAAVGLVMKFIPPHV